MAAAIVLAACGKDDFRGRLIANGVLSAGGPLPASNIPPLVQPTGPVNARVFNKSPTFAAGKANGYNFGFDNNTGLYTISPTTANNYDSLLSNVSVSGMTGGFLQNSDISVKTDSFDGTNFKTSALARAQADAFGNWNFSSMNDSNHRLGQLMAYFWINQEKIAAESALPGAWHSAGKNVNVYSYCYDANGTYGQSGPGLNAFWAGLQDNFVCMSYLSNFEAAYDASVYVHEMGHSNIDYATGGAITTATVKGVSTSITCSFDKFNYCCPAATGCADAINEGQADVHSYITFNSGKLGEFFLNDLLGLDGRDAELNDTLKAADVFAGTAINTVTGQAYGQYGQEIHELGGVWGSAWWTLRKNLGKDAADKIFFAHLQLLSGNDNFSTALSAIITADQTLVNNGVFQANHKAQIQAAFAQHGIN